MTIQQIKTRSDGSIDTGYYSERGRRMRSEAAHALSIRFFTEEGGALTRPAPRGARGGWINRMRSRLPRLV